MDTTYNRTNLLLKRLCFVAIVTFILTVHPFLAPQGTPVAQATEPTVPYLQNGSFETLTGGVPNNWTILGQRINLGTTVIAGCTTVDSTNYAAYRGAGVYPTNDDDTGTWGGNGATCYHVIRGPALVRD